MTSLKTGPSRLGMHLIAIPAAVSIILFLGYSSQWLFNTASSLEPGPLSTPESIVFNTLLACLWWAYFRACTVDPGRFLFDEPGTSDEPLRAAASSKDVSSRPRSASSSSSGSSSHSPTADAYAPVRWCKKCDAPKPARAHHCRHCRRCIPKMDHHCPWTGNCVSMQTFPHFLRFVVFTNASLWTLATLLSRRFYALYAQRYLPAYLGPTLPQLVHLTLLGLVCGATLLALSIMLYTAVQSWMFNTTMIEGWEIERHVAVLDRYSHSSSDGTWWGDDMDDDDDDYEEDDHERLERRARKAAALRMHVEFPYDLGIFNNMAQAMGTRNVFLWFLPFASGPQLAAHRTGLGWKWPENGFNDRHGMWPPIDPEKVRHAVARGTWGPTASGDDGASGYYGSSTATAFASSHDGPSGQQWSTPEEEKAAFQARQEADFRRRHVQQQQQQQLHDPREITGPIGQVGSDDEFEQGMDGEPGWTNADGDRLRDYGVDEEAEDDEDVPIATLLERRAANPGKDAPGKGKKNKRNKKKQ